MTTEVTIFTAWREQSLKPLLPGMSSSSKKFPKVEPLLLLTNACTVSAANRSTVSRFMPLGAQELILTCARHNIAGPVQPIEDDETRIDCMTKRWSSFAYSDNRVLTTIRTVERRNHCVMRRLPVVSANFLREIVHHDASSTQLPETTQRVRFLVSHRTAV